MQVYKAFFKIVRKRLGSVSMYFIIFIGIAIAMAKMGMNNEVGNFEQTKLNIAIENLDQGRLGEGLMEQLSLNNTVTPIPETDDELMDQMFNRRLDYVLYIPADFTSRFLAGEREELLTNQKVPSTTTGMFADNQVESYLSMVGLYLESGFNLEESIDYTNDTMKISSEVEFASGKDEASINPAVYYFRYLPYIFICSMVCILGPVLMNFNKRDISARNKCSSMSFTKRNLYLLLGSLILMLVAYGLMMIIAYMLYPDYVGTARGVYSMLNALIMILMSMALSYLATQIVQKETALNMFSNVVGLSMAFLGGVFVPLEIFGENVLKVSKFVPTYWYVITNDAIQNISGLGNLPLNIIQGLLVQSIYVIAILFIGLLVNRMKARES